MARLYFVHWKPGEAASRAAKLRAAGHEVVCGPQGPSFLRELRRNPPDAVVIDLNRLPGQGRDVGVALRSSKSLRHLPLVFVDGDPAKLPRIRKLLPDAVYTPWSRVRSSIRAAIANPPPQPVAPKSALAGYSGVPMVKKLGIRGGSVVALIGAPPDFEKTLGKLPQGVTLRRQLRGKFDLTLWFVRSQAELDRGIRRMAERLGPDGIWIVWPKKTSALAGDLSQAVVRRTGLATGLVDYKICAVDATWSGLRFTRGKRGRS